MFFNKPLAISKLYHVFNDKNTSLCGKYTVAKKNTEHRSEIDGRETWRYGIDCKVCFRKAGLKVE
jgi:hypothetical protein